MNNIWIQRSHREIERVYRKKTSNVLWAHLSLEHQLLNNEIQLSFLYSEIIAVFFLMFQYECSVVFGILFPSLCFNTSMQSFCQSSINFRTSHRFVKSMSTPRNVITDKYKKKTYICRYNRTSRFIITFWGWWSFLCDVDDDDEMREKPLNWAQYIIICVGIIK